MNKIFTGLMAAVLSLGIMGSSIQSADAGKRERRIVAGIGLGTLGAAIIARESRPHRRSHRRHYNDHYYDDDYYFGHRKYRRHSHYRHDRRWKKRRKYRRNVRRHKHHNYGRNGRANTQYPESWQAGK